MERFGLISNMIQLYDALAPHYTEYSKKKAAYLTAVDRFVLENVHGSPKRLLDVGAGDGRRGMMIAKALATKTVVLSDPSPKMASLCRHLEPAAVWQTAAEELPTDEGRFDLVLCLWNVLGHLPNRASRVRALARIRELLSEGGLLFFDVNNRHNAAMYGWARVLSRVVLDRMWQDDRRGDASFMWTIDGKELVAMGHLFVPCEIEQIIRESGLSVFRRVAVDYRNGRIRSSVLLGQLLFMAGR